jgi:tRNA pseudouridine55 synthase
MFGVLNLNKPSEKTSRDVVNIIQRIVKPAKVGHAGTLDPMATGVLLVCVGPATRLISLLQQAPKTYVAEFRFGERSDTDDATGTVEYVHDATEVSESQLLAALQTYVGTIAQVPPAFSAVKVQGQRAYAKARRGEEVQLTAKQVTVHAIDLLEYSWPVARLSIRCGSGTYIRSIARDLGVQLGCGGLMSALERTAIGEFNITNAVSAADLNAENIAEHITDAIRIVSHLPQYRCSADEVALLKAGRILNVVPEQLRVQSPAANDATVAVVCSEGMRLLAMGEIIDSGERIQPRAVFCHDRKS